LEEKMIYKCKSCGKTFKGLKRALIHLEVHLGVVVFEEVANFDKIKGEI
jgi:hypothetical protein